MAIELLAILHSWESEIRAARQLTPPALLKKEPTTDIEVQATCDFHLSHLDWTMGQEWAGEISSKLEAADIILCLVSAGFLASPYCNDKELQRAMERHEAGEALVIPVILKPADWITSPLGRLQALPDNSKPVTVWSNRDQAFASVAQGIRKAAQKLSEERPSQALAPLSPAPTTPPASTQSPHPGSIQSLDSTISYLSPIDSAVLKIACEEALIIGHENIDSCKVFLSNGKPRFPIAELKDSLKVLDQQKLIKCMDRIGGPEIPRVLITSIGFEICTHSGAVMQ
jgi:hypothetical protein